VGQSLAPGPGSLKPAGCQSPARALAKWQPMLALCIAGAGTAGTGRARSAA